MRRITVLIYEDLSAAVVLCDGATDLRKLGCSLHQWRDAGIGGVVDHPKAAGIWVWEGTDEHLTSDRPRLGNWRRATPTEMLVLQMKGRVERS